MLAYIVFTKVYETGKNTAVQLPKSDIVQEVISFTSLQLFFCIN